MFESPQPVLDLVADSDRPPPRALVDGMYAVRVAPTVEVDDTKPSSTKASSVKAVAGRDKTIATVSERASRMSEISESLMVFRSYHSLDQSTIGNRERALFAHEKLQERARLIAALPGSQCCW
jgi:hypothetical protein